MWVCPQSKKIALKFVFFFNFWETNIVDVQFNCVSMPSIELQGLKVKV